MGAAAVERFCQWKQCSSGLVTMQPYGCAGMGPVPCSPCSCPIPACLSFFKMSYYEISVEPQQVTVTVERPRVCSPSCDDTSPEHSMIPGPGTRPGTCVHGPLLLSVLLLSPSYSLLLRPTSSCTSCFRLNYPESVLPFVTKGLVI